MCVPENVIVQCVASRNANFWKPGISQGEVSVGSKTLWDLCFGSRVTSSAGPGLNELLMYPIITNLKGYQPSIVYTECILSD